MDVGTREAAGLVDWELAVATARRLSRPGPSVTADEAAETVAELRRCAAESEQHVRAYAELTAQSASAPVVVVDRRGWVQANVDGLRTVIDPLAARLQEGRPAPGAVVGAVGSRVTGAEAGALLAFLSGKVLGQFDPFYPGGAHAAYAGRLLLVAPNVVQAERELDVSPADFRLWVCLHEETHRVQFTAVPWLRDHVLDEIRSLVSGVELDPAAIGRMLREGAERVNRLFRGDSSVSLLDIVQSAEQRAGIERLTAVMSLLEGHADVVMDGVGPAVVPSVAEIRSSFESRRSGGSPLDQLLRQLLGLDAKLRQYRDGAAFVRGALDAVGMAGFNAVWTSPETLPTAAEIADPASWVRRVHG